MRFVKRRMRNMALLSMAIIVTLIAFKVIALSFYPQQYYSGWLLFALIVALLAFYIKKKLSMLPLGRNAAWAQWHYYLGLFLIAVFLIHVEFTLPDGSVEGLLTILLVTVAVVGIGGLIINRVFAQRLTYYVDEEIIYERIPKLRSELKQKLEQQLYASVAESGSATLSDYYLENLAGYFSKSQDILAHLIASRQSHLRRVQALELQILHFNEKEAAFALRLVEYLEKKNTLDNHFALQSLMKYWGLLHAPIGLMLFLVVLAHIVLVYAFRGAL